MGASFDPVAASAPEGIALRLLDRGGLESCLDGVVSLHRKCFSAPVDGGVIAWRYLENPAGEARAAAAFSGDRLVGFVGTMPGTVDAGPLRMDCAMVANIMTDPSCSGRGVFTGLMGLLEGSLAEAGCDFVYSFPNQHSNRVLVRDMGWRDVYEIPRLELRVDGARAAGGARGPDVARDDSFGLDYSGVWAACPEGRKGFARDAGRVRWRVLGNPCHSYANLAVAGAGGAVRSYATVRRYGGERNVVDFRFARAEDCRALVGAALSLAKEEGAERVTAWCPTNCWEHAELERAGFANRAPVTYFAGKAMTPRARGARLEEWAGWSVQAIDDNIY